MYLNKLLLKDFGKFHNKEISLKPGLNLIYGDSESGKSTVKEFVVGMLYGIDNSRGVSAKDDAYDSCKPYYSNGFSGKAYMNYQGKSHLIERSFLRYNKKTSVMDVQSGREIALKHANSLHGTMFELDKNTYVNSMCITEPEVTGKALAEELEQYLANLATTGSADINRASAVENLKAMRQEFDTNMLQKRIDRLEREISVFDSVDDDIDEVRKQIREVEDELAIETERRKREARQLIESSEKTSEEEDDEEFSYEKIKEEREREQQEEAAKEEQEKTAEDDQEETSKSKKKENVFLDADLLDDDEYRFHKKLSDQLWFICLVGLFVVGVIALMVNILPFEQGVRQLFVICTALFVIVTIVEGLYAKGAFDEEGSTPSDEEFKRMIYTLERKTEAKTEVEIDMSFAKPFLNRKSDLQDKEKVLLDKRAKRDELQEECDVYKKRLGESERELHAINLAINTLIDVSKEIQRDLGFVINDRISDIVARITDGKYTDVYLDNKRHVMVRDGEGYVGLDSLDDDSISQINLAVRLCVARYFYKDSVPIIFDDIFTSFDEHRLFNVFECLESIDTEQMILLTSNPYMGDMLDDLDLEYNYVEL